MLAVADLVDADLAVAGLVDVDAFALLAGGERDEAFMVVEREVRRLQVLQAALVRQVEVSQSYVDDAHLSVRGWLSAVTNCTPETAARQVRTARLLADMPVLAGACAAGRVGLDQVKVLAGLHANERCRPHLPDSDVLLTGHAASLRMRDFATVARRWQAHADPDGAFHDVEASRRNRDATIAALGAGYELRARGDGVTGEMLAEIFNAHVDAEYHSDVAQRAARYGDDAVNHPLDRTAAQRRHDALQQIFHKAAATTGDNVTVREPLVNIFCTPQDLQEAIRAWTGHTVTDDDRMAGGRVGMCETAGGVHIDPTTLLTAALIGQVRRVVVDPAGRVIDLGRRQRLFRGAARQAVLLSGDRCCWPGCNIRGDSIQIDHLTGYTLNGGETNPLNGGPACPLHNRAKHKHRIRVVRDHTGWHHYRPDGTEITPR